MGETKKCCCQRTKQRTPEEYKKLIHRLNRIEGQVRGYAEWWRRGSTAPTSWCSPRR